MPSTTIRLVEDRDAHALAEIYRPYVERTAVSFELEAPDAAEMGQRVAKLLPVAPWIVLEQRREVLGYAYAARHRERWAYQWSIDVSVYVDEPHRGRGLGRALYGSLLSLVRLQGFYSAYAGITLPNAASVGLHEGFGFHPVGVYQAVGFKGQAWRDVGWWQLALRDRVGEPRPAMHLEEARKCEGWEAAMAAGLQTLPAA